MNLIKLFRARFLLKKSNAIFCDHVHRKKQLPIHIDVMHCRLAETPGLNKPVRYAKCRMCQGTRRINREREQDIPFVCASYHANAVKTATNLL
jgi:hypothetical protein